ncbi:MAG TPA: diacylglycerol kinase [Planctomycetaceae bacterium]|nr:diacylglycerol kinase [Planctomycetaceae bacterium]
MAQQVQSVRLDVGMPCDDRPQRRRAAWRQRLVQAERGRVGGVRSDSVFFVHFFGISLVIAAALVLGVGVMQWIAIAACLTLVLTAEMFNQALKSLAQPDDRPCEPAAKRAMAMGTAAVMVACSGSSLVMTLVFWQRLQQIFEM